MIFEYFYIQNVKMSGINRISTEFYLTKQYFDWVKSQLEL